MNNNYSKNIINANRVVYSFTHPCGITITKSLDPKVLVTISSNIAALDITFATIDKCSKVNDRIIALLSSSDFDDVILGLCSLANHLKPYDKNKYNFLSDTINLYYEWIVTQVQYEDGDFDVIVK